MESKRRIDRIDLARGLSISMIVLAHVLRSGKVADYLSSTGVAAFFFLGGIVFTRREHWGRWLLLRVRKLYLPYLAVALISIVFYTLISRQAKSGIESAAGVAVAGDPNGILNNLAGMLYANSKNGSMKWNETLWFIPCYLLTTLLAVLVEEMVARTKEGTRIAVMIACFPLMYVITNISHLHLPFQAETALHMLPFFEAGILFRSTYLKDKKRAKAGTGFRFALFFVLSVLAAYLDGPISIRTDKYPHFPLSFLSLALGVLQVLLLSVLLETKDRKRWERALCTLGQESMGVMLWNKFPVVFFQLVLPKVLPVFKDVFSGDNTLSDLVLAAPVALVCVLLCLVLTFLLHCLKGRAGKILFREKC